MADFTIVPTTTPPTADGLQTNQAQNVISSAPVTPAQLGWLLNVGPVLAITGNSITPQNITLPALTGTVNGQPWAIAVGQTLILDPGTPTQELAQILVVNPANNTVNVLVRNNHTAGTAAVMFLDSARSAMQPDLSSPRGAQLVNLAGLDPLTNTVNAGRAATTNNIPARGAPLSAPAVVNPVGLLDRATSTGAGRLETSDQDLLQQILIELRTTNFLLQEGLGTASDPDEFRAMAQVDFPTN